MKSKTCSTCNLDKPISAFAVDPRYKDGCRGQCSTCRSRLNKNYKKRAIDHAPPGHKTCSGCGTIKPISAFGKHETCVGGKRRRCRVCCSTAAKAHAKTYSRPKPSYIVERNRALRNKYGITHQDYVDLLAEQGGGCALCGRKPKFDKPLSVDHCHKTGRVRGILCPRCNRALAQLGDNESGLKKAALYISNPSKT